MTEHVNDKPDLEVQTEKPILEVRDVVAGYRDLDILRGVSIYADPGEIICIIGPNGAGKSTLVKTIFGLLSPRRGDIRFRGRSLPGMKPSEIVKEGICYVPQERNVFPTLSVRENLEVGGHLLREGRREAMERVFTLFPVLKERLRQKAGTLSGGERQMLAMGRALMLDPRLLMLDEPSAGLSPQMVETVFDKIKQTNRAGCTILMVEQNARRALSMSDRGYVLDMGRNAMEGTGRQLLSDPQVAKLYLGEGGERSAGNQ